jgi:hypothetical protein
MVEYKFKKGDLIKAFLPGTRIKHICIILEDEQEDGHTKCLSVCNFTSKIGKKSDYSIDISSYNLPDDWFNPIKPTSWIRCNEIGCLHMTNFTVDDILGNLIVMFPDLWKEICKAVYSCPISDKLKQFCDCEYEMIEQKISEGEINIPDCGCK